MHIILETPRLVLRQFTRGDVDEWEGRTAGGARN
jgi:hypothetical protein